VRYKAADTQRLENATTKNLVASTYLHSHTYLFLEAVDFTNKASYFSKKSKTTTATIVAYLKQTSELMQKREMEFFREFGCNKTTVEASCREFNKKLEVSELIYQIIKTINSNEFMMLLNKGYNTNFDDIRDYVTKKIEQDDTIESAKIKKDFLDKIASNKIFLVNEAMFYLFGEAKGNEKYKKARTTTSKNFKKNCESAMDEMIKRKIIEITDDNVLDMEKMTASKMENIIITYLNNKIADSKLNRQMQKIISSAMKNFTKNTGFSFKLTTKNTISGFLGEFSTEILLEEILNSMDVSLSSQYLGAKIDSRTRRQSPVDFLVGKYGIQVKNALTGGNTFKDIRLIRSKDLNTFAGAFQNKEIENQYKYLITNMFWLCNQGMDSDRNLSVLKTGDIPEIMQYIFNLTTQNIEESLGVKDLELEQTIATNYGNVFILFNAKYLIPMSSVVDTMILTIKNSDKEKNTSVSYGSFSTKTRAFEEKKYTKEESEIKTNAQSLDRNALLNEKHAALESITNYNGAYRYPRQLREVGTNAANKLIPSIGVKMNYTLELSKLEEAAMRLVKIYK